jgi:hypothetical protein
MKLRREKWSAQHHSEPKSLGHVNWFSDHCTGSPKGENGQKECGKGRDAGISLNFEENDVSTSEFRNHMFSQFATSLYLCCSFLPDIK